MGIRFVRRSGFVVAALLAGSVGATTPAARAAAAPADSVSISPAGTALRSDSTRVSPDSTTLHPDSTAVRRAPVPALADSIAEEASLLAAREERAARRGEIDSDRLRYDGRTTPRRQFESRWPILAPALPFGSDAFDTPVTLDAGVPLGGWRTHATDRTAVSGYPLIIGPANAATAVGAPGFAAADPFFVTKWETSAPRGPMTGPAELLAGPRPVLWWEPALRDRGATPGVTTSALLYEKGAYGDEQAGARFAAPAFGKGIAGAYVWRAADGASSFVRATDKRYSVAAALPDVAGVTGWVDGDIAWRRLEGAFADYIADGEALLDDRRLGLHLERRRGLVEQRLEAGVARSGHTLVDAEKARERWSEPSWTLGSETSWRPAIGWTWIAAAHATGRNIRSRVGPAATSSGVVDGAFAATRNEGRVTIGVRREPVAAADGARRSWSADLAYDGRAGDRGFLDARLGAAVASPRGSAAIDLESSHQRATWEDRLAPSRDRYFDDVFYLAKPLRYSVAADPALAPRRLDGAVARATWRPGPTLELSASGSARHVADDFGWDLSRLETADSILVTDRAVRRGSGWVSHASLQAAASWRSIHVRALGWVRGGSSRLSPQAGSPPRLGGDASVDAGATLFQGDLPLRLGIDAHVTGKRESPIRAPALAVFDASLRADFTEAGLFLRIDDCFDRRPPSGAYEIATDAGVPTVGRRFRFGVTWHLSD